MTREQVQRMHDEIEVHAYKLLERVNKYCASTEKYTWAELMNVADIMKDLSEIGKNLAKTKHYMTGRTETVL